MLLVVGLRLGCLNHARLTYEAIRTGGAPFAGWIGNRIDPEFAYVDENLATLGRLLEGAPLSVIPAMSPPDTNLVAGMLADHVLARLE